MNIEMTALLLISSLSRGLFGQSGDLPGRYDLKSPLTEVRAPDDPLAALTAFVEIAPIQPIVGRGIEFSLTITNNGSHAVDLLDPLEFVRIELKNAEGLRVELPAPPSLLKVNTRDVEGFRRQWEGRRPYVLADPGARDDVGLRDTIPKIHLNPEEEFTRRIRIPRVLAAPEVYWAKAHELIRGAPRDRAIPPELPPVTPIRVGVYTLKVSVLLGIDPQASPRPRSMDTESMTVRLGSE